MDPEGKCGILFFELAIWPNPFNNRIATTKSNEMSPIYSQIVVLLPTKENNRMVDQRLSFLSL